MSRLQRVRFDVLRDALIDMDTIPFNRPFLTGKELWYMAQAQVNRHLSGDGPFTKDVQSMLQLRTGSAKVLLTHSCTAALEMAAILSGVKDGDEVILPSYTFVSTANAFVLRGARPVFVDIRPDTLNIDESLIEEAITERTRVIVPVHYAGIACEMETIMTLAEKKGLLVVEDAAQAVGSSYRGRSPGAIGDLGTFSFHETKNISSGEGGALLINNALYNERAEVIREKGTNRSRFLRGFVDKYTWVDIGSSFLPGDMVAAFLKAQVEEMDIINRARMQIWDHYHAGVLDLEQKGYLRRPIVPTGVVHNAHMYYILLEDQNVRDRVISSLREKGISAVFHYVPLHSSEFGRSVGRAVGDLHVTVDASARLLRLPLFAGMTIEMADRVMEAMKEVI